MPDIIIKQDDKPEEKKAVDRIEVEEAITKADQIQKMKEDNDALELQIQRKKELEAQAAIGGTADAGQPEQSRGEKDEAEASAILDTYR